MGTHARPTADEVAAVVAEGRYEVCPGCGCYRSKGEPCGRAAQKLAEAQAAGQAVVPTGLYDVDLDPDDPARVPAQDQWETASQENAPYGVPHIPADIEEETEHEVPYFTPAPPKRSVRTVGVTVTTDPTGQPREHVLALSLQELIGLRWMLDTVGEDTLFSAEVGEEGIVLTCSECGCTGYDTTSIEHTAGCDIAPIMAVLRLIDTLYPRRDRKISGPDPERTVVDSPGDRSGEVN